MQDIRQETLNECTRAEQSASVVLWEIDLTEVGGERYFFCNEQNEKGEPVTWQGRQYQPYPIQGSGFELNGKGTSTRPTLTVSNLYGMVRVYDDQPFDRQIVIPAVAFSGAKHEREHTDIYSSCRLIVRKNGAEIYNRTALDNTLIYSGVIDMPAGHGHMTLEFSVSAWLVNNWYPTASISDLLVVVMKKATAGISIS
ncbi:phage minor tail protein L [Escherichia coli]